ncbi:MAG: hypothetical protein K8T10_09270, partial [Candidatus Eremiobacteraeota bacterium]|nr:hypothetical protein [Candidatus Eremiobacteraeota bacterium]
EGNSFIYEMSAKDFSDHFTDNNGKPQVMTNHSVFLYPDVNKLPKIPPKATYNTFSRYRKLHDYITNHKGKFSPVDAIHAMSLVAAHTIDKDEGATYPIPCRTFWRLLYDLDDLTLQVRFYLRDGKKDPKTGDPTLIFTKPYEFKLNVKK